jgi:uncharacterized SAM-binding protein YcdF (DUF218 family)
VPGFKPRRAPSLTDSPASARKPKAAGSGADSVGSDDGAGSFGSAATVSPSGPSASAIRGGRSRRSRGRLLRRLLLVAVGLGVLYVGVTYLQVRHQEGLDEARLADAIVVLGAAQFNGRPSPVLEARLSHAYDLWKQGLAPIIVVTGGKQPGDQFTEASTGATYLIGRGVPDKAIQREVQGASSWESIAASARFLKAAHRTKVILVSDPYHSLRIKGIAAEVGLTPYSSPTRTSPEHHVSSHEWKETLGVAVGRIIGYRRLLRITG